MPDFLPNFQIHPKTDPENDAPPKAAEQVPLADEDQVQDRDLPDTIRKQGEL